MIGNIHPMQRREGFTLIELMLAIAIIAVISGIVIAALNPTRQLASTRNAKRQSDVSTILNAVYQYAIDNQGRMPSNIPTTAMGICRTGSLTCNNGIDLTVLTGAYLVSVPVDPQQPEVGTGTNYFIRRDTNGRLTVSAPGAEDAQNISQTR